jgi:hypothetical protein
MIRKMDLVSNVKFYLWFIEYPDGSRFEGNFFEDKKEGMGKVY